MKKEPILPLQATLDGRFSSAFAIDSAPPSWLNFGRFGIIVCVAQV